MIDWKEIWETFETWMCDNEDNRNYYPEWEEQQDKIEELVDVYIRKGRID